MAALRPFVLPRAFSSLAISASSLCLRAQRFTTSAPAHAARIPPDSPLYINVPNPPQDQSIEASRSLKPVRGHLPLPRKVFRSRRSGYRPTNKKMDSMAPQPTSHLSKAPVRSDKQAWKRAMAANRRDNARAGIQDLWQRKLLSDNIAAQRRAANFAKNFRAAHAPEPLDERLTRASIHPETLKTAVAPDPLRFKRAQASRARSAALERARSERRIEAVQELYMNARSFIVTEKELEAEVEKEFAPDHFSSLGKTASGRWVYNIWDLHGKPQAMNDMMRDVSGSSSNLVDNITRASTRTLKRQKLVAEQLTGGKMD